MALNFNNADYGITLQKLICEEYNLDVNATAKQHFISNYNNQYEEELRLVAQNIFKQIGLKPVRLLTYTKESINNKQTTSPHNFLLSNGKTLSIKTTKSSNKIAPKTVGQAGYKVLNDYFSEIYENEIQSQEDVRDLVFNHIDKILPTFIDCLFQSDYTVFVNRTSLPNFEIIKSEEIGQLSFDRKDFSFTRDLKSWVESTTLKYEGTSIAEIQTHRERTFKFRFFTSAIPKWYQRAKENNETFGISAEAAICKYFALEQPASFANRRSRMIMSELEPVIENAFKGLPKAIRHTGSQSGERGAQSKCSYDFVLDGNLTLSLKTNKGKMVCPPEVGQPSGKTCYKYFREFLPQDSEIVTNESFKKMVFEHIAEIVPIYINHLFDSNWLLWIYKEKDKYYYKTINQADIQEYNWEESKFSFTKPNIESWNESNTLKYDGITIGEFQVHNNRSSFKFRFKLDNLLRVLNR